MKNKLTLSALLALFGFVAALLAAQSGGGGSGGPGGPSGGGGSGAGPGPGPNSNASAGAQATHALITRFQLQRQDYLTQRDQLLQRLRLATGAERTALLAQLRTESQARETEERALARQIREELKQQREASKSGRP